MEKNSFYKFWKSFVFSTELKVHFYLSKWPWIKKFVSQNVSNIEFYYQIHLRQNYLRRSQISPYPTVGLFPLLPAAAHRPWEPNFSDIYAPNSSETCPTQPNQSFKCLICSELLHSVEDLKLHSEEDHDLSIDLDKVEGHIWRRFHF